MKHFGVYAFGIRAFKKIDSEEEREHRIKFLKFVLKELEKEPEEPSIYQALSAELMFHLRADDQ